MRHSPNSPAFPGQEKFPFITMATDKKIYLTVPLVDFSHQRLLFCQYDVRKQNKSHAVHKCSTILFEPDLFIDQRHSISGVVLEEALLCISD